MRADLAKKLTLALKQINRPGSFCTSGSVPAVLPGLEVENLGPIALPLTDAQASDLIQQCQQAPYGKGEKTLVDTSVRCVWRLEPEHFELKNPAWEPLVGQIVSQVQKDLGLEKQELESHIYDLLVYEPGSFFLSHQDGEKLDRMVATLVVILPSTYEGGELVVRHDGQEKVIDFSGTENSRFQIYFAAFYADCEHEIRPLKSGHRLCLVYNLTLAKAKKPITAPRPSEHLGAITEILQQWAEEEADKLVVTLEHQYTADGLTWDTLKGADRAKARILCEAAAAAGCKAYLCLLTYWESGSAEPSYDYRPRRRRGGWYDDDDDEEEDAGEHEMGEVFDESLSVNHLTGLEGDSLPLQEMYLEEDDLLDPEALRKIQPEEDFEGYTGNAGMTLQRWYRHAAVILWPQRAHFAILGEQPGGQVLPVLNQMVQQWRKARGQTAATLREQCVQLATALLAGWPERQYRHSFREEQEADQLLQPLATLDEPSLLATYLGEVLVKDCTLTPGKLLVKVCEKHGWQTFAPQLLTVAQATTINSLERNVPLLEQLCSAQPKKKEGWLDLCRELAEPIVQTLQAVVTARGEENWQVRNLKLKDILASLVRALLLTGQDELLRQVVQHALEVPRYYSLEETHVPVLTSLRDWLKQQLTKPSAPLAHWLAECRRQLETLTAKEPQEPRDFRRAAPLSCKCAHCSQIKRFLEDPQEKVFRFRARQDERGHLEHQIQAHQCDVDCTTERKGSPHTLVCTKNTASYQAKHRKYQQDLERLATVRAIEGELPPN